MYPGILTLSLPPHRLRLLAAQQGVVRARLRHAVQQLGGARHLDRVVLRRKLRVRSSTAAAAPSSAQKIEVWAPGQYRQGKALRGIWIFFFSVRQSRCYRHLEHLECSQ